MPDPIIQKFIEERQARYTQAWLNADVSKLLDWHTDDIDYSDHGINAPHMNKAALKPWIESLYSSMAGLSFETVTLSGTKEFTAWEWKSRLVLKVDMEVLGAKKGDRVEMIGASLVWWDLDAKGVENQEDGKVKVIAEYSKIVGKGH